VKKATRKEMRSVMCETVFIFVADIVVSAVGAFFGFLFALRLEKTIERKTRRERVVLAREGIQRELSEIDESLQEYLEKQIPLRFTIHTPYWDSLIYGGFAAELIGEDIYLPAVTAYAQIATQNQAMNSQTLEENLQHLHTIQQSAKAFANIYSKIPKERTKVKC
jgi:hypothetical protein